MQCEISFKIYEFFFLKDFHTLKNANVLVLAFDLIPRGQGMSLSQGGQYLW
jgi:hypothetical protein